MSRPPARALDRWLERNGEDGAAASLRKGMEETLTVLKLQLPPALRGFLATTNVIENLIGSVRRLTPNITRWRAGDMISRWTALGVLPCRATLPTHQRQSPSANARASVAQRDFAD